MRKILYVSLLLILGSAYSYELELGIGSAMTRYAYKKYETEWLIYPVVDFENEYLYVRDFAIGAKLFTLKDSNNDPALLFSFYGAYDYLEFDRKDSSDPQLRALKSRKSGIIMGPKLDTVTKAGIFSLSAARDVWNRGNGTYGTITYYLPIDVKVVEFYPSVGIRCSDAKYNKYYYGVNSAEAARSGLKKYAPGWSADPYAGLTAYVPIGKHWEIVGHTEASFLADNIRDSPMVSGSTVWLVSLALNYLF